MQIPFKNTKEPQTIKAAPLYSSEHKSLSNSEHKRYHVFTTPGNNSENLREHPLFARLQGNRHSDSVGSTSKIHPESDHFEVS